MGDYKDYFKHCKEHDGLLWAILFVYYKFAAEDYPIVGKVIMPAIISAITSIVTLKLLT